MSAVNTNIRFLLWRKNPNRDEWPEMLRRWVGCWRPRADEILRGEPPDDVEVEKFAEAVDIDVADLQFAHLVEQSGTNVLHENLKHLLGAVDHGMKTKIAAALGVHPTSVSRWLSGQRPETKQLRGIAEVFHLDRHVDLEQDPIFLSALPVSDAQRRAWLRRQIDALDGEAVRELFPAFERLLRKQ